MNTPSPDDATVQLVVFSDDWGRHPSSCQHLINRLVRRHHVVWVNTIGMRTPSLSKEDLGKAARKVQSWLKPPRKDEHKDDGPSVPANMTVIHPRMWPGFRTAWQRRLNARLMAQAVHRALGPRTPGGPKRIAITTLPITADLAGKLDVDRWVYYCVDDFSVWPGLDGPTMCDMERQQAVKMDRTVVVSENLRDRLAAMGCESDLLTHGIDLDHWVSTSPSHPVQTAQSDEAGDAEQAESALDCFAGLPRPILLFWGLIDTRLDMAWCRALAQAKLGSVVLVGPQQSPDPALATLPGVTLPGPADYQTLPALARQADVLLMPYADLPVTRAMQPLKFKEYLATGKPVVARRLPGIVDWQDAADLLDDADAFVDRIKHRLAQGMDDTQRHARARLALETWDHKAAQFEAMLLED